MTDFSNANDIPALSINVLDILYKHLIKINHVF